METTHQINKVELRTLRMEDYDQLAGSFKRIYGDSDEFWTHAQIKKLIDIEAKLRPLMAEQPRGRQITGVYVIHHPLPRTATGKIKRWELQQETETL